MKGLPGFGGGSGRKRVAGQWDEPGVSVHLIVSRIISRVHCADENNSAWIGKGDCSSEIVPVRDLRVKAAGRATLAHGCNRGLDIKPLQRMVLTVVLWAATISDKLF